jgi:hypothetical protein
MTVAVILILATAPRIWQLGRLSFWYDEVVTMRLAQAPGPGALLDRLSEIDATRAPLHPLLLQAWVRLFGTSETSARGLSVLCGVVTVALVCWIGRLAFDSQTGLWAAWIAAWSPLLVYYSREARMYAWLVMVSCLCWGLLFSLRDSRSWRRMAAYLLGLTALLYSHPLGLLMAATLGLASLLFVGRFRGDWRRWLACHGIAILLAAPWLQHYFDHSPEFLSGRLPIKFLFGTPIGFIGGNSSVLLGLALLIVYGLARRSRDFATVRDWAGPACLVLWLVVPPILLYAYSWLSSPIFGPARYTVFVAPAYLILIGQGLSRVPKLVGWSLGLAIPLISASALGPTVYAADLKADWRAFSETVALQMARNPSARITVLVSSHDAGRNVEVETARYYLPKRCRVEPLIEDLDDEFTGLKPGEVVDLVISVGRDSKPAAPLSRKTASFIAGASLSRYPGLVVYERVGRPARPRLLPREPAASGPQDPG